MRTERLVLLTIDTDLGRVAARRLAARFPGLAIIVEERVPRWSLLRARLKRLGVVQVAGQLAFMVLGRVLIRCSQPRIRMLKDRFRLDDRWPDGAALVRVASVNAPDCVAALNRIDPHVVLVVGTRIIRREVLAAVPVSFINYHAGITPKYRGIHGGYWAKAGGDPKNFGVTVCGFRRLRPGDPIERGHAFRSKAATCSEEGGRGAVAGMRIWVRVSWRRQDWCAEL